MAIIDLNRIATFVRVVEQKSFTSAAKDMRDTRLYGQPDRRGARGRAERAAAPPHDAQAEPHRCRPALLRPHAGDRPRGQRCGARHHRLRRCAAGLKVGVANQKNYISLYFCAADDDGYVAERFKERLPKANIGKSCVRFKKLEDLDRKALTELMRLTAKTGFGF